VHVSLHPVYHFVVAEVTTVAFELVKVRVCDNVVDRQLTIGALSGPEAAGIHDRREEGDQVGEASEYRHRCA
jgi:hypothetical protein